MAIPRSDVGANAVKSTLTDAPNIPAGASAQQAKFITEIWPYVVRESQRTGIPVEVFIIQSGRETGWGTSWLYRVAHNPAGVGAFDSSHGAQFASLSDGFATYADRLMGHGEGGQGPFVADVQRGASASQLLDDLQRGPWAGGHYDFGSGKGLTANFAALYGGGGGSNATQGTGGVSGSGGQSADVQGSIFSDVGGAALKGVLGPLGSVIDLIPGVNGIKAADAVFSMIAAVFLNWRWTLELFIGAGMLAVGALLIFNDVAEKKVQQVAPEIIGAMAAA